MAIRPWGSNWETTSKGVWNDGAPLEEFLGNPDAPPIARKHLAQGGSKGGGGGTTYQGSTTSIPPEVLARYNAVNARAETAATQPFQDYSGEFVAPVNPTQQGGVQGITGAAGTAQPYFNAATNAVTGGLGAAQPYFGTATGQVADAAASGAGLNQQALGTLNSGLGAAQPFNASAGANFNNAYAGAQPYQMGATGLALAGTSGVNPGQLNINGFMSPYNDAVVQSTLNLVDQQQGRDLRSQRDQQIMSGAFGGDGSNIGRSVLQGQQGLARASIASSLYNQNYSQALGAAQQQQGIGLGAAQANRAALQQGASSLAGIGQQGFTQGLGLGQAQQGLGQQIYGQGLGAAQGQASIGQQGFNQGLGAAQANLGIGQGLYGMGANAGTTLAGLGTGLLGAQLQQGQAQIGAGTIQQQTQQAQDQAIYNQFLQQQGYPFQVAQFLANIAEGTGALSGSTTSGYSAAPQPFFSDERLKENVRTIGHTRDGLRIVSFRYKGSPHTQIGMLAQDVEKKRPEAVGLHAGYKTVDYDAATRKALGGAVANDNAGTGYAGGGYATGLDQNLLAQILLAHRAMYPGAHDPAGVASGTGPRGMQISQPAAARSLQAAKLPEVKELEPQLRTAMRTASDIGTAGKGVSDLWGLGKEAAIGTPEVKDASGRVVRPATGGLAGRGGEWSPNDGWIGRQVGMPSKGALGGAGVSPPGSITSGALPPVEAVPAPSNVSALASDAHGTNVAAADPADMGMVNDATDILARRGGRIQRLAAGGMPYAGHGYIPEDDYSPISVPALLRSAESVGSKTKDNKDGKSDVAAGVGMAKDAASLGKSLFSLFGNGGGGGAADAGGIGAAGGAGDMVGSGAGELGGFAGFIARGGRIKREDGGGIKHSNVWMEIPGEVGGGIIGSIYGGPIGGMAGSKAGKNVGDIAGDAIGGNWDGVGADVLAGIEGGLKPPKMPGLGGMAQGGATPYGDHGYLPDEAQGPLDIGKLIDEQKGLGGADRMSAPQRPSDSGQRGFSPLSLLGLQRGGRAGYDDGGLVPTSDLSDAQFALAPDLIDRPAGSNVVPFPAPRDPVDIGPDGRYGDRVPPSLPMPARAPTGLAPQPAPRAIAPADNFDAPENVIGRHWTQESGARQFKPDGTPVTSSKGAVGYTQMQAAGPEAAKLAGVAWDPERLKTDEGYNRLLGETWFKHLHETYGDPYKAAAAYNAGKGSLNNALKLATERGGNYWDHLPAETQNHLYVVSGGKLGKPLQQSQVNAALSLVNGPAASEGFAPTAGVGSIDLSLPPKEVKQGNWLDRNERAIVTGLTFLGNMLGSPSRQLPGAIGHGLAAAAPAYAEMGFKQQHAGQEQQQIQLGGQRLGIAERAQYITVLAQLRAMQAARSARGLPADSALNSQISHIAGMINGSISGMPPGAAPETSAPSGGTPPVAAQSGALPAPAAAPAPPPQADALVARHRTLQDLPTQFSDPKFLSSLHPEENPLELYRRADQIADDGTPNGAHAQAVARADRAVQGMKDRGYAYDKNMMPVMIPGMPQTQRAREMIPLNTVWSAKESGANAERQAARQSLDLIRSALEEYQTNAGGEIRADFQRWLKAANIDVPNSAKMNAAAVQEIIKQTAARASAGGDTDMARALTRAASVDPLKEPEANKKILAQAYADLNARDAEYRHLQPRISAVPQLDTPYERERWARENPREKFAEDAYRNLGVMGATPVDRFGAPDRAQMKPDHTYVLTPDEATKLYGRRENAPIKIRVGSDGSIDRVR